MTDDASLPAAFPPRRAATWRLRTRTLAFGRLPRLMGIVNVTPDSFSDGGRYSRADRAIAHAEALAAAGADVLDLGGESTRPYSRPVSAAEEAARVVPVVAALCRRLSVPVSIDTSKASVAEAALDAGAEIVNDVTGLTGDPEMPDLVRRTRPGVCAMHMQGTPQTMQDAPTYGDVVAEIEAYLAARLARLVDAGLDPATVCLDPGIGFGKTHQHNLDLLAAAGRFVGLGQPVLIGHSRKGFIARVISDRDALRDAGTAGVACALARAGVQVIRVHDVATVRQALALFDAAGGLDGRPATVPPSA